MTELRTRGFEIIDGPFSTDGVSEVADAYDTVFGTLSKERIKRGSTSARFGGLAGLEPFYRIYVHAPLLELAREYLGGPFKLSSFHARTLQPHTPAPPLHQDVRPGADGDPLVGFIFMVDPFRADNGATRFLPGAKQLARPPRDVPEQQACGPAGSLLVFDGATWHEHGANRTDTPRRSIQGYFVRREHTAAVRWSEELSGEQAKHISAEARSLLCL
jgi:hypothetical protein